MEHNSFSRRRSTRARVLFAVAAVLLVAASCETARSIAGHGPSPFMLFGRDDMRAGIPFSVLDEAARRESPIHYNCWDTLPAQKMRMCKTTISPGDLFALVGPNKRVVRLLFVSYEPSRLEENYQSDNFKRTIATAQQMMASFDSVMPRRTLPGQPVEFRWVENDPKYSAAMWYMPRDYYLKRSRNDDQVKEILRRTYRDSLALIPDSIAITDEKAYAELLAKNPRVKYVPPAPEPEAEANVAPLPPSPADRLASMRTELERLARAQEDYRASHARYASTLDELGFTPEGGVTIQIRAATAAGFTAASGHPVLSKAVCVVYGGDVKTIPEAGAMGAPTAAGFAMCDPG